MKYGIGFGIGTLALAIPLGITLEFTQGYDFLTGLLIGVIVGGPLGLGITILATSKNRSTQQESKDPLHPASTPQESRNSQIITRKIPPKIPAPEHLDRAIVLLGNRTKSDLKPESKEELTELIGEYPDTKQQAAAWKSFLKRYKKDPQTDKVSTRSNNDR